MMKSMIKERGKIKIKSIKSNKQKHTKSYSTELVHKVYTFGILIINYDTQTISLFSKKKLRMNNSSLKMVLCT